MIATQAKRLATIGCLYFVSVSAAQAADADGNYALRGIGNANCGEIIGMFQNGGDASLQQALSNWMSGYTASHNRLAADTYDMVPIISADQLLNITLLICQQNSDANFETALRAVFDLFDSSRLTSASPIIDATHDGVTVQIRQDTLRQLQQKLAEQGLYESDLDGLYGPGTRAALEQFQTASGLTVTGLPDLDTKLNLLLDLEQ